MEDAPAGIHVRRASLNDARAIAEIYTMSIEARDSTMDMNPFTTRQAQDLLGGLNSREAVLVAEVEGAVAGWGIVKKYSDRPGYARACETSVYVDRSRTGDGIGSRIQPALHEWARTAGYHHIVTRIWAANSGSIRFHRKHGFSLVGIQTEIGFVDGEWKDIAVMQKILDPEKAASK